MNLMKQLWQDESGVVISAELVLVGTITVLAAVVGLKALANSINDELTEVSKAFRSLDQSYSFSGQKGCSAWTAGSCYQQGDAEKAKAELMKKVEDDNAKMQKEIEALQERMKIQQNEIQPKKKKDKDSKKNAENQEVEQTEADAV